jgi:hypothetical protein
MRGSTLWTGPLASGRFCQVRIFRIALPLAGHAVPGAKSPSSCSKKHLCRRTSHRRPAHTLWVRSKLSVSPPHRIQAQGECQAAVHVATA